MTEYNCCLEKQEALLLAALSYSPVLMEILHGAEAFGLKNYYIGAGCICQSVWNSQNGLDPMYGIGDVDFVYYDAADLSWEGEDGVISRVKGQFAHLPVEIDVKNQARVHLWYKKHFGKEISPYQSLESAINTWPTTATAVGVRIERDRFMVYAPYGLQDLFGQIVRANKTQITKEIYEAKCAKWTAKWKSLTVIPW